MPEDKVVIFLSGHGFTSAEGSFYFLPYDTGTTPFAKAADLKNVAISSDDLSSWIRGIDAANITLIIDACHAAGTVEAYGFKPGPMGSRGLGQLAYDKGMQILAATRSDSFAIEVEQLREGLLTYALTIDGLQLGQADRLPRDGSITMTELLQYAVQRVPQIYAEVRRGSIQHFSTTQGRKDISVDQELSTAPSIPDRDAFIQQPMLFDFSRKANTFTIIGPDPYDAPAAAYLSYVTLHNPSAEEKSLETAASIKDSRQRSAALRTFLNEYPNSSSQTIARLLLLNTLLDLNAPSPELVGVAREAVTFLRDPSSKPLEWRLSALTEVAERLLERNENLEDALAFVQEARMIFKRYAPEQESPDVLQRVLQNALKKVATISRGEGRPLPDAVLEIATRPGDVAPRKGKPSLLYYGAASSEIGRRVAALVLDRAARSGTDVPSLIFVEPKDTESVGGAGLAIKRPDRGLYITDAGSLASALGVYALPTVFVSDASNQIRFRNSGFTEDLDQILDLQLKEVFRVSQ